MHVGFGQGYLLKGGHLKDRRGCGKGDIKMSVREDGDNVDGAATDARPVTCSVTRFLVG
jgi:hypothetical protein